MPTNTSGSGTPAPRMDIDPRTAGRRDGPRLAAVVSDGSALHIDDRPLTTDSLAMLLEDDAAGIHARTGAPVRAMPISARDAEDLTTQLLHLPPDTGAIFLTHTDPDRARTAQRAIHKASAQVVLTDADAITITLTAALLTTVARAGLEPMASRVIIIGASPLPELCPLLITTGVGDISTWTASDARAFPLHHVTRHATAVIDLLGATRHPSGWIPGDRRSAVISPTDPTYRLLPTPGLLAALVRHPDATSDLDMFAACAQALVAATPPGRLVPDIDDPHLTEAIASAVKRILTQRSSSDRQGPPHTIH